jgi:hypothetical protein
VTMVLQGVPVKIRTAPGGGSPHVNAGKGDIYDRGCRPDTPFS